MYINKKWITTLFFAAIVGTVLFAAAACAPQGRAPTSAILKTPTPAQTDLVSDSTQADTSPTAVEAAANELSIQRSSGYTVELDIFSGVPNPTWELSLPEASDLASRISTLNPTETAGQYPDNLGYRGFIVQITAANSASIYTVRAYHGIVEIVDSTRTIYYLDPQRQIELWLLATAKPALGEDLTAEIVKEIARDRP